MNLPRHAKHPIDSSVYNRMMRKPEQELTTEQAIRKAVTDITGVDPLCDTGYQGSEFVRSRQLFMYFIRKHAKLSQYATARLLGKDHSTVVHAEKCVLKFKLIESEYCEMFDAIERKIKRHKLTNN